ncbi:MAG TPA: hypothetical protein VEA59_01430 [Patescibacteria group bacterium]|nr:hypothetical protein [Patescibacteria group bacterium]
MKQEGYIALVSVIVLMSVLLIITLALSQVSFFARFNVISRENKKISRYLAEACADEALLYVANNPSYSVASGGQTITLDAIAGTGCKVCSVGTGSTRVILTRAKHKDSYTNLQVTASLTNSSISITSWLENPTYSGPSCGI